MTLFAYSSRKLTGCLFLQCQRKVASLPDVQSILTDPVARTSLLPAQQTSAQIGMWYQMGKDNPKLFEMEGFPNKYRPIMETFNERCLMVRRPALEVIDCMNRADYNQNAYKYIFYGRKGVGRTFSLAHILDYLHDSKFLIVHAGRPKLWTTRYGEIIPALKNETMFDHTADAAKFLQHFMNQNRALIQELQLETKGTYEMSQREKIEPANLIHMLQYGIEKPRYASQVVTHLFEELKTMANNKEVKLAVVADGINAFFQKHTEFHDKSSLYIHPTRFTLITAFINLLTSKWKNGCIVGVVGSTDGTKDTRKSNLPRTLLRTEGWDALDPFLPIEVKDYTKQEFRSALLYYTDRKWLQHPMTCTKQGVMELEYLTAYNPRVLHESCLSK